jgi:hypothetical protein
MGIFKKKIQEEIKSSGKTPEEIKFDELTAQLGLPMAVAICQGILPEKFWKELTLEQRTEICKDSDGNNGLATKTMSDAIAAANSPATCIAVYQATPDKCQNQRMEVLGKALKLAKSPAECLEIVDAIYDRSGRLDDTARELGLAKAIEMANSVAECKVVLDSNFCDREARNKVTAKIIGLATVSFVDCLWAFERCNNDEANRRALERLLSLAQTFDQCYRVLDFEEDMVPSETKDKFAEKGIELAEYTLPCLLIRKNIVNPEIKKKAADKAVALANSADAWLRINDLVEDPDLREEMLKKATQQLGSLEDCKKLYTRLGSEHSESITEILERARELANIAPTTV